MAQEIKVGEFTFQSTTDSKTITISDEKFAELQQTEILIKSLDNLSRRLA